MSYMFAVYENKGTKPERGSHAVSFIPNHILSVMERTVHIICVLLYFLRALPLVLVYYAGEYMHIAFHPTLSHIKLT
jgi:hypothetical protein